MATINTIIEYEYGAGLAQATAGKEEMHNATLAGCRYGTPISNKNHGIKYVIISRPRHNLDFALTKLVT